ncbi:MAG TPA: hypothetical protein VKM72_24655 [Thermoanaerobaculia bacterium]|nr:hypothetical protein [Thermoanaerobaculia bacterium]
MDVSLLADAVTQMLAPALPALVLGGQDLVADAAKALGTEAWKKVTTLWGKLRGRIEQKPAASEAAQDVARSPEDPDALAALRYQIKKILAEDEAFAAEIAQLVGGPSFEANLQGSGAIAQGGSVAAGAGGIAVGRDVHGGIVLGGNPKRRDRDGAE